MKTKSKTHDNETTNHASLPIQEARVHHHHKY
jgi:hypothetical protein